MTKGEHRNTFDRMVIYSIDLSIQVLFFVRLEIMVVLESNW